MNDQKTQGNTDSTFSELVQTYASVKATFLAFTKEAVKLSNLVKRVDKYHTDDKVRALPGEALKVSGAALAENIDQITEVLKGMNI